MKKIDGFWLAAASLLYPPTEPARLISLDQITRRYEELFGRAPTPSLEQSIISWKQRYVDRARPSQGGSPKRYLFRTDDGSTPSPRGRFRLYKTSDSAHDGQGKNGATCPGMEEIPKRYHYLVKWYLKHYQHSSHAPAAETESLEAAAASAQAEIKRSDISATEKARLIKARHGQGIFRKRVFRVESACRLTGITDERFLVASHIKPWAISNNDERLDGHNGLLLAPHVDRLFDRGFITFNQEGGVIVSLDAKEVWQQWGLLLAMPVPLSARQEEYMRYHRDYRFRGRK
ncbi:HNH endonuclease [Corallococcus sp. CA054B]|uniref:HNH endonuclease n=1 Tax=Corallococcus sp. CA054B TaxID=2316734 RepID=UPI000EA06602|nr:HNH endonuclease [Corallococcus sp. CA054B]RKG69785.1 HNH endonuclease [Corallococcus sp. CA054B]